MVLAHVSCGVARPASRREARSLAAGAVECLPNVYDAIPETAEWFLQAREQHQRSIDRRVTREKAMQGRRAVSKAVQPGLFDRRALRAAEDMSETERANAAEHEQRITALERARRLQPASTPIAVLIVWR
jgi:hypothetical protein